MSDLAPILQARTAWAGAPLALASVISTWGSAPRPRGSHMIVHGDGRMAGSVSGGCVEGEVLAMAARVIATGTAERRSFGVADDVAWEAGLPCGGSIDILVQPVSEEGYPPALFDAFAAAREEGRPLAVATDLASGRSRLAVPDEDEGLFVTVHAPPRRLFIVGGVQIAQSLCAIAQSLSIVPTVIDPRGRFLTAERFPGAMLDDRWPDEALAALRPNAGSAVVTLSHDPKIDDPGLLAALATPAAYIAALGSRRSHAARLDRLAAAGADAASLARIQAPAGIDIGAVGTAEIALSVAAGMIAAFNRRRP